MADNLKHLARDVSDMEIVLFEAPGRSNMPMRSEVLALRNLCTELEMTCTVHFPVDMRAAENASERKKDEDACLRTIELFEPLEPFGWVLHLVGRKGQPFPGCETACWLENAEKSTSRIATELQDRQTLCAETLDYNFSVAQNLVKLLGISVCFDIGHVMLLGLPVLEQLALFLDQTRIVHLHGVATDGLDHVDLSHCDGAFLKNVHALLLGDGKERVVTIEVFEDDYNRSVEVLKAMDRSWIR